MQQWRIPGFVKRGGRESKFPARPEKVAQCVGGGGGTPTHFFPGIFLPTFTLLGRHGRGTVRLPDRPPGWQAKKKKKKKKKKIARKKKKKKNRPKEGGAAAAAPPPGSATVQSCALL